MTTTPAAAVATTTAPRTVKTRPPPPPSRIPPPPVVSANTRAAAGSSIAETLRVLDAFNHRHRNQHRATHWWSSFRILRHRLQRLRDDLALPARGRGDLVHVRAAWLRNHVVPRAYLSFSQLAADNQHAPLGLLLLAILARVETVLVILVPHEHNNTQPSSLTTQPYRDDANNAHPSPRETELRAPDHGVAVSREDILRRGDAAVEHINETVSSEPKNKRPWDLQPEADRGDVKGKQRKSNKKNKAKDGDAFASLFGSLA
ncbi:ribonuclease MRP protein subunit RMP1 [Purpureocillium lavendulum]|uniref:Ribonuclease MRP protein subunit RMP1 n=1 Tax=Purpureocillium lavendulum TaxID=1247861 RepID=A0AB34FUC4_9HYPO|nr:ribonuclease MRP protein subunit RMP1 [Purpureocillium lavendulum]